MYESVHNFQIQELPFLPMLRIAPTTVQCGVRKTCPGDREHSRERGKVYTVHESTLTVVPAQCPILWLVSTPTYAL